MSADDRERIRERADGIRLVLVVGVIVGVGAGFAMMIYRSSGCGSGDPQCVAHPYVAVGVALAVISVLLGLLSWLVLLVLNALLDRPSDVS